MATKGGDAETERLHDTRKGEIENISSRFVEELNRHGQPLQHSLVRAVQRFRSMSLIDWQDEPLEFPVTVRGQPYNVDLLLSRDRGHHLLVVECKRVQPKFKTWVFAADLNPFAKENKRQIHREMLIRDTGAGTIGVRSPVAISSAEFADVGQELKLRTREGESNSSETTGRKAIEDAITQVMRGINGIVNHIAKRIDQANFNQQYIIEPVVVTTASLFLHPLDISQADLNDGNIASGEPARQVPWLCLDRVVSPGIKHDWTAAGHQNAHIRQRWTEMLRGNSEQALRIDYEADYLRTVHIVTATKFGEFLGWIAGAR